MGVTYKECRLRICTAGQESQSQQLLKEESAPPSITRQGRIGGKQHSSPTQVCKRQGVPHIPLSWAFVWCLRSRMSLRSRSRGVERVGLVGRWVARESYLDSSGCDKSESYSQLSLWYGYVWWIGSMIMRKPSRGSNVRWFEIKELPPACWTSPRDRSSSWF